MKQFNKNLVLDSVSKQAHAITLMYQQLTNNYYYSQYTKIARQMLQTVKNGDRIIITGVGKNSNLATKAAETFVSLGIPAMYINTGHYSHGDAGFILDNDMVLHISRSGTTAEMQFMKNHLRSTRPNIVQALLHCNNKLIVKELEPVDSEYKKYIDGFNYTFGIRDVVECDKHSLAPTTSTTVLLVLLDSLAILLSDTLGFTKEDFYRFHPGGALGEMLRQTL